LVLNWGYVTRKKQRVIVWGIRILATSCRLYGKKKVGRGASLVRTFEHGGKAAQGQRRVGEISRTLLKDPIKSTTSGEIVEKGR